MAVDWNKPIQFASGMPCMLYATNSTGYSRPRSRLDGNPTRMISSASWPEFVFSYEDGTSADAPRFDVANVEELPTIYPTVSIVDDAFDVYASVSAADAYLEVSTTDAGAAWRSVDDATKSRALMLSTRGLDAAAWLGAKTYPTQALKFPRTGLKGVNPTALPDQITFACVELAAALLVDPELSSILFRPSNAVARFFPASVAALVSQWLTS